MESREYYEKNANIIEETLQMFDKPAVVTGFNVGPTITLYKLDPKKRIDETGAMAVSKKPTKISDIQALAQDLQLALKALSIRIEQIKGTGLIGIELPNKNRETVLMKDLVRETHVKGLEIALGRKIDGSIIVADIAKLPHLIIAGATGSGKSVCINAIVSTLLMNNTPEQLRFMLVDPKRVELSIYRDVPHLMAPIVDEVENTMSAINVVVTEMDNRYKLLQEASCRNIEAYNNTERNLPYIILLIDEVADIMLQKRDEVEPLLVRIAQLGRAAGVHMILSSQRATVNTFTGLLKANVVTRVAFAVASQVDSRVILDEGGAEQLTGNGDGLFSNENGLSRFQGCFITDDEIDSIVSYRVKKHRKHID